MSIIKYIFNFNKVADAIMDERNVYRVAYKNYLADNYDVLTDTFEWFYQNVDKNDVKYKKYFKEYLREKKLRRICDENTL